MQIKQKKSGIYFLEYEGPDASGAIGRRRVSLDTRDMADARAQKRLWMLGTHPKQNLLSTAKADPLIERKASEVAGWTVRKALQKCEETVWKNAKAKASLYSNIKIVNAYVGDELVSAMTYRRIEQLIDTLRAEGLAPGTIKRKLDVLSKAVSMSSAWDDPKTGKPYITGKPKWPSLRFDNERTRELLVHEEKLVLACIDERIKTDPQKPWWRFRALVTTLLATGLRLSEALCMDDAHLSTGPALDPATGAMGTATYHGVRPEESKNGKARSVPLSPAVLDLAPLLSMQSGGGSWFPFKPAGAWQMWDYIRKDVAVAGGAIEDVTLHTLRHTYASRLRRRGVSLEHISKLLGHSSITITISRYVHIDDPDLAAAVGFVAVPEPNSSNRLIEEGKSSERTGPHFLIDEDYRANNGTAHS